MYYTLSELVSAAVFSPHATGLFFAIHTYLMSQTLSQVTFTKSTVLLYTGPFLRRQWVLHTSAPLPRTRTLSPTHSGYSNKLNLHLHSVKYNVILLLVTSSSHSCICLNVMLSKIRLSSSTMIKLIIASNFVKI